MIRNIISKRYSKAFVETLDDYELEDTKKDIENIITFVKENKDIEQFFFNPVIDKDPKKEVMTKLGQRLKFSKEIHKLLNLMIEKERIYFLYNICNKIIDDINHRLKIFDFHLVTAHKIDKETMKKIKDYVQNYVPGKVNFIHRVDKNTKGGFFAYNNNLAIDATIKNNFENFIKNV